MINALLVGFGLFIGQATNNDSIPHLDGRWILNFEKSKLEHRAAGLTGSIFIIKQQGENFQLTRTHQFGDRNKTLRFKMKADGKTRTVKVLFKGKLESMENELRATLWRKDFHNVVSYHFGHDQNELVADETFRGKPKNHHNVWVFERE